LQPAKMNFAIADAITAMENASLCAPDFGLLRKG